MKVVIDFGHGVGSDRGAQGLQSEESMINATGAKVVELLKAKGHQVLLVRPSNAKTVGDSLKQRVTAANNSNADLYVSIHYNAFNGTAKGSEVFASSEKGKKYAKAVASNIAKLGYTDRGVKDGSHLYVIKNTSMPAILVEGCFIDNAEDIARFNADAIAAAIVEGVTNC